MAKLCCGSTDMIAAAVVLSAKLLASLLYGNERTVVGRIYYPLQMLLALV